MIWGSLVSILPSSLPCLRAERRPVTSVASGLLPASTFNPLDVSRDSMRHPLSRSSLERFFEKSSFPFETCDTFRKFFNPSRARVLKLTTGANPIENCIFFCNPQKKTSFFVRVLQKLRPVRFYRVLYCFLSVKKCHFSSMGRILFERSAGLRSSVRARIVFFTVELKIVVFR